jgi:uncharacterized protein
MECSFIPSFWGKNPHIQTVFGSLKFRLSGKNRMLDASKEMIIDSVQGARLLGFYSPQSAAPPKGLILLIHGWEGSSDSTYILSTGKYLYDQGYEIFRLNLRDHGDSHHLNEGLFHGALTEETFHAARNVALLAHDLPFYLVGFSLGGNFSLRIALRHGDLPIPNLKRVFSISPPLDPHKATIAIDRSLLIYRFYFLNKWKRSLLKKQSLFPAKYDFRNILKERTCMSLTEAIMPYYPDYGTYREYFKRYTLLGDAFHDLSLPVTIITAADDPIVSVSDFYELGHHKYLQLLIQQYGGHCGFLDFFPTRCWYEKIIAQIIADGATDT